MKPLCEKVIPDENSSWRYFRYEWDHMDLNWHYHPEYEICLTLNSYGMRYVGDHIARYGDYDLVMQVLNTEIKRSLEEFGKAIFVCKFLSGDLSPQ